MANKPNFPASSKKYKKKQNVSLTEKEQQVSIEKEKKKIPVYDEEKEEKKERILKLIFIAVLILFTCFYIYSQWL